ncbi:MFS transporter [Paraburkholderia ginsengiterrae]|uniref:MFS transporter n=1 Tax=Paraburkholderia ginsengiterrae TaxID=1462993 RepID=UPI001041E66E|nr:MFS transporter [Paraburkholderia ginsengiterrae]
MTEDFNSRRVVKTVHSFGVNVTQNDSDVVFSFESALDRKSIGRYQFFIFFLCFICLVFDGYDAYAMAYVAPLLRVDLALNHSSIGQAFSASLVGMFVGAIVLSPIADILGRRKVTVAALLVSGLSMLASAKAQIFGELFIARALTGFGLGVILPNALSICAEFAPSKRRFLTVMLVSLGMSAGGAIGGPVAALLISSSGWRGVFVAGGLASIMVAFCMAFWMPESLNFLIRREGNLSTSAQRIAVKVFGPGIAASLTPFSAPASTKGAPFLELFAHRRTLQTLCIWAIAFCNLLCLYLLASWLPILCQEAGLGYRDAALATSVMQIGGLAGVLLLGSLARRTNPKLVLLVGYVIGAAAIYAVVPTLHMGIGPLAVATFVAGTSIIGGQAGIQAVGLDLYPQAVHSTGMGWALGVGRLGSVCGPILAGELMMRGLSTQSVVNLGAIAALIGGISTGFLFLLDIRLRRNQRVTTVTENNQRAMIRTHT